MYVETFHCFNESRVVLKTNSISVYKRLKGKFILNFANCRLLYLKCKYNLKFKRRNVYTQKETNTNTNTNVTTLLPNLNNKTYIKENNLQT